MDKEISGEVLDVVKRYIKEIEKKYNIAEAYLFGSYAKGNSTDNSDIDIAIICNDFSDKFDFMVELLMLKTYIDLRIEPHPFKEDEFQVETPFVHEIKKTGLKVA